MTSVVSSPLRIAIVDDDPELAKTTGWDLEDAGYESWLLVNGSYTDVNQLASQIAANAQGAVCDNRLSYSGLANFYGAQLVAALYQRQIPSLLITQYADIDAPLSIRKYRKQIPILLSRDKVDGAIIRQGIEKCRREFRGEFSPGRKSYRTLVRISDVEEESGEKVIDAFIPGWNPHRAVRFPAALVPEALHYALKPNVRLFARVNIAAETSEELYFEKFELATPPDDNDGLA